MAVLNIAPDFPERNIKGWFL